MNEHPSRDELAALRTGGLIPEREREVLCHLLTPCEQCLAAVPPPLGVYLGSERVRRESAAEEEAGYTEALQRAARTVLEEERHLRRVRAQADKILKILKSGDGLKAVEKIPQNTSVMARMTAFLDHSWQLRHEDPQQMVEFAWLAKVAAENLDARWYGPKRVLDFQARAHAELGNAYRVANRPTEAGEPLSRARELFERGNAERGS